MPVSRIKCPECGAGLSSKTGFEEGQTVCCPKCETYFTVEDPAEAPVGARKPMRAVVEDDEEDDRPRKKKKRRDDDEKERSYKNSPARYAVLGLLVLVMCALGVMLYLKMNKKWLWKEEDTSSTPGGNVIPPDQFIQPPVGGPGAVNANIGGGGGPKGGGGNPKLPGGGGGVPKGGGGINPGAVNDLLGGLGGQPRNPGETQQLTTKLTGQLAGAWEGKLADGGTRRVEYRANGTFTDTVTGGSAPREQTGTWKATLVGSKGLKLDRTGGGRTPVRVTFEGDELIHDGDAPGVSVVLRKK